MRPEQMCDCLVVMEVSRANPHFSQQPVIVTIGGQEYRVIITWTLTELKNAKDKGKGKKKIKCSIADMSVVCRGFLKYLYGYGHDLVLNVLVEKTDWRCKVLHCAWICAVWTDSI